MSRSIIVTMNDIFNYLKSFITEDDVLLIKEHQRHIKASGDENITENIVKRAVLLNHVKEPLAPVLGFSYEGNTYCSSK